MHPITRGGTKKFFVRCGNDCAATIARYDTEDEAAEAWNKRVPVVSRVDLVARIAAALQALMGRERR